jgi:hypothetical protein
MGFRCSSAVLCVLAPGGIMQSKDICIVGGGM